MNNYDSSKIISILNNKNNFELVDNAEQAEILILNTCSIRMKPQEKLFHQLGRWYKLKKKNPKIIICVGGCVAVQEGIKIFKRFKDVNIIFGPKTIHKLPIMIKNILNNNNKIINVTSKKMNKFKYFDNLIYDKPTAFISIIEGCNKCCSYCIVPLTRGKEISRPYTNIINEINYLTTQGVKEIHLLGQNVNSYIDNKNKNDICNFAKLLKLISLNEKIKRIRFTTSNPVNFTDDIIEAFKNINKLVNFIHLPVQSGSNNILKKMKRQYTTYDYINIINKLKKVRPNIKISSDFIVGFPGETDEDFNQTIKFIQEVDFDTSFSFIYSSRPKTVAARMQDTVDINKKKERLYMLQNVINKQTKKFNNLMFNTKKIILVEGISRKNRKELYGRTEDNRIVNFPGNKKLIGKFIKVKIIDILSNSLRGIYLKKKNYV